MPKPLSTQRLSHTPIRPSRRLLRRQVTTRAAGATWHAHTPILFFLLLSLLPFPAMAVQIIAENDWDPGPHVWTSEYDVVDLTTPSTGGNTGGWLRIDFDASADPADAEDVVRTSASSLFAGAWASNMWIEFDFYASNAVPDHIQVWFGTTNDHIWMSDDLDYSGTGTWSTIGGPQFLEAYWNPDEFWYDFETDFSALDWIGVYIWRGATDHQIYGIDNFRLMIPEPGELTLLAVAAMTSVASLRRKRRRKKKPPWDTG